MIIVVFLFVVVVDKMVVVVVDMWFEQFFYVKSYTHKTYTRTHNQKHVSSSSLPKEFKTRNTDAAMKFIP